MHLILPTVCMRVLQTSNQAAAKSSLPAPHRPRSAPVGPASYSTQVALARPPGPAFDVRLSFGSPMYSSPQRSWIITLLRVVNYMWPGTAQGSACVAGFVMCSATDGAIAASLSSPRVSSTYWEH